MEDQKIYRLSRYHKNKFYDVVEILDEIFLPYQPDNRYLISNYGRVYSTISKFLLLPFISNTGYVTFHINGRNISAHRMVAMTFIPTNDLTLDVNHIDGIKTNNYYKNLEWCTRSENVKHAVQNNLLFKSPIPNKDRYSDDVVNKICECLEKGYSYREISNYIGIPLSRKLREEFHRIKNRVTKRHISKNYNF